jgi:hypothetical protein
MSVKNCSKCNQTKDISNFCKHPNTKDKLNSTCKTCNNIYSKQWKINNPEKNKESHQKNFKKYYTPKEKTPIDVRKQQIREYQNEWMRNRRKNPTVKLNNSIMHSIWKSLTKNNIQKDTKTLQIVGLESWNKFKEHIESQFTEGMNWNNYGNKKDCWSIDHIIPKSLANNLEEVKKLNHYSNLRPMWHLDNIKKSNKN